MMRRRLVMAACVYGIGSLGLWLGSWWLDRTSTGTAGLVRSIYTGSRATLADRRVVRQISLLTADEAAAVGLPVRITWEGLWYFPGDTVIELTAWADDRVTVTLDGESIAHDISRGEAPVGHRFPVAQGFRHLEIRYEESGGRADLDLQWAPVSFAARSIPTERLFTGASLQRAQRVLGLRRLARLFWLGVPLLVVLVFLVRRAVLALARLVVPPAASTAGTLSSRATVVLVTTALAIAALVRLWGIDFSLPHTRSRPDEEALIGMALQFIQGSLDPGFFIYGPLYSYGLTIPYGVYYAWGLVTGMFDLPVDVAASWHRHSTPLFLMSRLQSATLGTATVLAIYRLALRLFDRETAIVSAFVLALAYLHARDSHFGTVDVAMALLILLSIHFLLRARQRPGGLDDVWAGSLAGLAMATKYNAGLLSVPFAADLALRVWPGQWALAPTIATRYVIRVAVPAALVFLMAAPYTILGYEQFMSTVQMIGDGLRTGAGFADLGAGWTYHARSTLPYGLGTPVLVALLAGLAVSARRDWRGTLLLCAFPAVYYLVTGSYRWVFVRYMMPVVPFLCLFAALGIVWTARQLTQPGWPRALATAGLTLVVLWPSASRLLQFDRLVARRDSRVVAADWVHEHVPAGSTILQNGGDYGRVQFDAAAGYKEGTNEQAATALAADSSAPHPDEIDWIILHESPLGRHVDPAVVSLVAERYELVEFVKGSGSSTAANVFDLQDALYVPYAGFEDVARPGPDIRIYRKRPW